MTLNNLLKFDNIVIQCHDNPDADALASGFGLYCFFKYHKKDVEFIYRGSHEIRKSNLRIMIEELGTPAIYAPSYNKKPELLIMTDCQYGQKNVTKTPAENIAVIDHHQCTEDTMLFSEIRSFCSKGNPASDNIFFTCYNPFNL